MSDYQVIGRTDSRQLAEFLAKEGQFLLPMVELVEQAQVAIDEVIDVTGRATIEAVLALSAQQVAGPKHRGKAAGPIRWHGRQRGHISLGQRKLHVQRPRVRDDVLDEAVRQRREFLEPPAVESPGVAVALK